MSNEHLEELSRSLFMLLSTRFSHTKERGEEHAARTQLRDACTTATQTVPALRWSLIDWCTELQNLSMAYFEATPERIEFALDQFLKQTCTLEGFIPENVVEAIRCYAEDFGEQREQSAYKNYSRARTLINK